MKNFVFFLCLAFLPSLLEAQPRPEGKTTVDPFYTDGGNTSRQRNVPTSTSSLVMISSAPENAVYESTGTRNLGITTWRSRFVVNKSTCLSLAIYPTNRGYDQYSSSRGVVLSSDTVIGSGGVGRGEGGSRQITHQDEIWGIWSPDGTCGPGGQGALIEETYFSEPKKR